MFGRHISEVFGTMDNLSEILVNFLFLSEKIKALIGRSGLDWKVSIVVYGIWRCVNTDYMNRGMNIHKHQLDIARL